MEGFGNRLSDIDVVVVGGNSRRATSIRYSVDASRWIDVTYLSEDELSRIVSALPDPSADFSDWTVNRAVSFSVLEQLHDLCYGVVLNSPSNGLGLPRGKEFRRALSTSWARSNLVGARARWQDAVGALSDGQHFQACYARSICIGLCIDGYTALFGETDINVKWRFAKLARVHARGRDCLGLYERCVASGGIDGFSWQECAKLLFDVICLATKSGLYEPSLPLADGERLELDQERWVRVDLNGYSHLVPAPRHLGQIDFAEADD